MNAAQNWLNGEISMGKMLDTFKVPRGPGDDLVGALWQAFEERITALKNELEDRRKRAERDMAEASKANKPLDEAAESASRLAYVTALSSLRVHLLSAIERTTQG